VCSDPGNMHHLHRLLCLGLQLPHTQTPPIPNTMVCISARALLPKRITTPLAVMKNVEGSSLACAPSIATTAATHPHPLVLPGLH
jgi:hypothetical protein